MYPIYIMILGLITNYFYFLHDLLYKNLNYETLPATILLFILRKRPMCQIKPIQTSPSTSFPIDYIHLVQLPAFYIKAFISCSISTFLISHLWISLFSYETITIENQKRRKFIWKDSL